MLTGVEINGWELTSLILCFLGSGFFSGAEAALMSLGMDRAKQIIEEGGSKAKAMTFMVQNPNELLATILVGNNVVNILAASLTTTIANRMFESDAIAISTGVTTIIILIFGEVIPKTFARNHAEKLSFFILFILRIKFYLTYPIIKSIVWLIKTVLGENAELTGRLVTKNDIEYFIQKAEKDNTMDSKQIDLLNSILEFPTIKVKDIMIPRLEVGYVQISYNFNELMKELEKENFTRYPVCDGDLENTVGFLHVKDLAFVRGEGKSKFSLKKFINEPFFVYEHMKIQAVFDHMNKKKVHMALVKDENGLVVGIVTLEDIIEEIFGEIHDEHDTEESHAVGSGEQNIIDGITVEGTISLRELYNDFELKIPLNDNFSTLAGFILDMLGNNFPEEGQIIVWEGYSFDLKRVEDYEIKEVRIRDVDGEKHLYSKRQANKSDRESSESEDMQDDDAAEQKSSSQGRGNKIQDH